MTLLNMHLRALRIDPERGVVEELFVEPHEIRDLLGGGRVDTVDLDTLHCLVIGGNERGTESRTRFRLAGGRPYFGTALVLGLVNGNWASATLDAFDVDGRTTWEEWDAAQGCYVAMASRKVGR